MLQCPLPINKYPTVVLGHGGGGRLSQILIESLFVKTFGDECLNRRHDGAVFDLSSSRVAFSTDSFVVKPIFFHGGNIGSLAINGTVNDLAMCGAEAKVLSLGFILEEGFPMENLWRIVQSIKETVDRCQVKIVTGDTKVVERGKADGVYINTSGIGVLKHDQLVAPHQVREGDVIILSGDIGRHGMAIMSERENLGFESRIESDCASLKDPVMELFKEKIEVHCLRDLTRGGLGSAVVEIAEAAGVEMELQQNEILVNAQVKAACEILGLDPIHVANEGRFICILPKSQAESALTVFRYFPVSSEARIIGNVGKSDSKTRVGRVTIKSPYGTSRQLDMISGEQLPRIC